MSRPTGSPAWGRAALLFIATTVVIGAALPVRLAAQQERRSAAILLLMGNDTLVVERVQRDERTVSALIAVVGQPRISLTYTLDPTGEISGTSFAVFGANSPADAAPLQDGSVRIIGDSAVLDVRSGGNTRNIRVGTTNGALPIMNNDFVVVEQAVHRARALGVTSLTFPLFALSGAQTIEGTIELIGADSARFSVGNNVTEVSLDAAGNVTGGSVPAQGVRIVVIVGPEAARISLGRPDYSAPAGAPYTAEEVVVPAGGHVLAGTLTRPSGTTGRLAAVVTITGSGLQDRDEFIPFAGGIRIFRQVADTLTRRGIVVLRLDDRGVGGSGGDVFNTTTADFADDIRAAVAYLRSRSDIDPARIALVGHSEGGMIAPMVAASDPKLAAIVLMAGPAYTGQRIIEYQVENGVRGDSAIGEADKDSIIAASRAQFDSTTARIAWMRFFLTYDPLPTARKVKQPVLILQGATDQQVRAEEARLLERALHDAGNTRVTTVIFPDRNHLFLRDPNGHPSGYLRLKDPHVDGEVLGTLADWLATTLRVR